MRSPPILPAPIWGLIAVGQRRAGLSRRCTSVSMPGPSISEAEPTGWRRWLPGVAALAGYQREWLRGDVLAGVTVAAYLVPQVMAYASVAGLPPVVGLWAVIYPLLAYAVFGSSRQLSVGPEATTALMTAAAVAALVGQVGAQRHAEVAAVLALVVGALCLLGRLLRLGFLSNLLSKPVLIGYLAGVAVMMIIGQLGKIARLSIDAAQPMAQAIEPGQRVSDVHLSSLLLGLGTLALLPAMWRSHRNCPAPCWPSSPQPCEQHFRSAGQEWPWSAPSRLACRPWDCPIRAVYSLVRCC